ncbi:hydroxyethylthiazole kinase-like uncharacterized protein yjeF [Brevundimonas sp. SORGH_AS 993]|nr:hydroxyethylthiazole kinase-like uncharacterized protein yjeF [Brevundimonas sp. SORGH_AS_0993]
MSGRAHQTGAARLAARAGLRIGAGVVRILCPPDAAPVIAPAIEAVMLTPFGSADALGREVETADAVVIGPAAGLDDATVLNLQAVALSGAVLVIDADALTMFKDRSAELFALLDRDDVLTPHEGEFERLFPGLLAQGRDTAALEAARRAQAVVVLKGAETIIASPDGRIRKNPNGSPWLATAGSGDVLAGMIGGLIAQRMSSFDAASAAVWLHSETAAVFGPGLISEDLPETLPKVLRALWIQNLPQ